MCKYQSWFRVNQRCSALKIQCFRDKKISFETALFSSETALIQKKSGLISSETKLISADVYHVLWISAEKRQNYETALFSADYLWDFNLGLIKCYKKLSYTHAYSRIELLANIIRRWDLNFTILLWVRFYVNVDFVLRKTWVKAEGGMTRIF